MAHSFVAAWAIIMHLHLIAQAQDYCPSLPTGDNSAICIIGNFSRALVLLVQYPDHTLQIRISLSSEYELLTPTGSWVVQSTNTPISCPIFLSYVPTPLLLNVRFRYYAPGNMYHQMKFISPYVGLPIWNITAQIQPNGSPNITYYGRIP